MFFYFFYHKLKGLRKIIWFAPKMLSILVMPTLNIVFFAKEYLNNKFLISERVNSIHFEPGLR